jgi:methyl-accepting chemotaxis protein
MSIFTNEENRMRRISQFLTVFNLLQVFVVIVLISLAITAWSLYNIFQADQVTRQMREEAHELMAVEAMEVYFIEEFTAEKNYLLTGDDKYIAEFNEYKEQTHHYLEEAQDHVATESDRVALANLERVTENYNDNFDHIVEVYESGSHEEAIQMSLEESEEKLGRVHEQVEDMIFNSETHLQEEVEIVDDRIRSAIFTGVLGLVMFPVLAVWAFVVSSRMTMPFLTLTNAVAALAGSRFRLELLGTVHERRDGLGLLARTLRKAAMQVEAREAALQAEVDQLAAQVQERKARRLVTSIPGRSPFKHINPN